MKLLVAGMVAVVVATGVSAQSRTRSAPPFPKPKLEDVVAKQAERIEELTKRVEALERKLADLERLVVAVEPGSDIDKAIREKRLAVGMTLAQAERAMGGAGKLIHEDSEVKRYQWDVYRPGSYIPPSRGYPGELSEGQLTHSIVGDFQGGKLVSHSRLGG